MVGHCYDGLPLEACGLLAGPKGTGAGAGGDAKATVCYPTRNAARSSRVYEVHGLDYRDADDDADAKGLEILGVFHSHTHTDPYPSPTDVASALFPQWHYVLVSLRDEAPMTRSYRIVDGKIAEEPVVVIP
jgi:proteasome lid subunit RPN8/RPN11